MNKKMLLIIPCLMLVGLLSLFMINKVNSKDIKTQNDIPSSNIELSFYVYINSDNELSLKHKLTNEIQILDKQVIDLELGLNTIVYISKGSGSKRLISYSMQTKEKKVIRDYYSNEFIIYENSLFLVEKGKVLEFDLNSDNSKELFDVGTDDLIFNYVNKDKLIFSHMKNSVPTTQSYIFTTKATEIVSFDATNITVLGDYIYGLNKSSNIFRIDSENNIEIISDFTVIKFYIDNNYLIYIDEQGVLNSLDLNSSNRVISKLASNFFVNNNDLYYITPSSKNTIYKTQLNGRHKEIIIENAHNEFIFKLFSD